MPPRIEDAKRSEILKDVKAGQKSRGQIARDHDVSTFTVSKVAKEAGITDAFNREQTENATRAAVADNRALRTELSRRMLEEAKRALDDMHGQYTVFSFGGKDNTYAEKTLPEPPTADKRNLMVIAATAVDKHIVIDRHDSGAGVDEAVSLLDRIMGGLKSKHGDTPDDRDADA